MHVRLHPGSGLLRPPCDQARLQNISSPQAPLHVRLRPGARLGLVCLPRGQATKHLLLEARRAVDTVPVPPGAEVVAVAGVRRAALEPAVGGHLLGDHETCAGELIGWNGMDALEPTVAAEEAEGQS